LKASACGWVALVVSDGFGWFQMVSGVFGCFWVVSLEDEVDLAQCLPASTFSVLEAFTHISFKGGKVKTRLRKATVFPTLEKFRKVWGRGRN